MSQGSSRKESRLDSQACTTIARIDMQVRSLAEGKVDTEADMLSGISRKRNAHSSHYWFSEFCNSQCLSHFAAPFIGVRAKTSIAESFKSMFKKDTEVPRIEANMLGKEAKAERRKTNPKPSHPRGQHASQGREASHTKMQNEV